MDNIIIMQNTECLSGQTQRKLLESCVHFRLIISYLSEEEVHNENDNVYYMLIHHQFHFMKQKLCHS